MASPSVVTERPAYKLYGPGLVAVATFFGGYVGGALVLARNFWVVRQRRPAISIFVALTFLAVASSVLLPPDAQRAIGVLSMFVTWFLAWLLQRRLIQDHEKAGGTLGSALAALGFGIQGWVLSLGVGWVLNDRANPLPPRHVRIGRDDAVYYHRGATESEARRLGEYLKSSGLFDDDREQLAVLSKDQPDVLVSFVCLGQQWNDPDVARELERLAAGMSETVFAEQPVQVLLCDQLYRVKRRLSPQTGVSTSAWEKHFQAAEQAYDQENYGDAERAYRAAVKEAERHERLRPQLVWSLNNVGYTRLHQALVEDVEPHFQRALTLSASVFGKDSYEGSFALHGLARWEWKRGNLDSADAYFRRALSMREAVQDARKPDEAEIRGGLVDLLIARDSFASAWEIQQQAVARVETPGTDPASAAGRLRLLGWLELQLGKYPEARQHLELALAAFEQGAKLDTDEYVRCVLEADAANEACGNTAAAERVLRTAIQHLEAAGAAAPRRRQQLQEKLATTFAEQEKYEESEQLLQQILQERESSLGPDHTDVAITSMRLGKLALQRGQPDAAEARLGRALKIFAAAGAPLLLQSAECLLIFGQLRQAQGHPEEAEPLYRQALQIREQILGPEDGEVALTLSALSRLYADRGDSAAAEPLAQRAQDLLAQQLGPENPALVPTLHHLALVQVDQNKLEAAEQTLRRALRVGQKALGVQHPHVLVAQNTLAVVLIEQKKFEEAESLLRQCLQNTEAVLGADHSKLVGPLNNLGKLFEKRENYTAAAEQFERALRLAERHFGTDHPDLLPALDNSARVLRHLNRLEESQMMEQRAEAIRARQKPRAPALPRSVNA